MSHKNPAITHILRGLLPALLLSLILVQAMPGLGQAAHGPWSTPQRLGSGWFPEVAADAAGGAHVFWASTTPGFDVVIYRSTTDGSTWTTANDVVALPQVVGGSEVTRASAVVSPEGILHLSFRDNDVQYSHVPVQDADSAAGWGIPQKITTDRQSYFSRLALDGKGVLHMIHTTNLQSSDCQVCYHPYYRRSTDGGLTWTEPIDISVGADPTGAAKPQILVDAQNGIHVIWEAGQGGTLGHVNEPVTIRYAVSYDEGITWSTPIFLAAPRDGSAYNPALGLDGQGKLIAAWLVEPEDHIYFAISENLGRTWSAPQSLPGVWGGWAAFNTRQDGYSMATDSAGNVHLVLVGRTSADSQALNVLHLTWNGTAWSAPEVITTYSGAVPEWPRIAIGNGNVLNLAWHVRDAEHVWDTDNGSYEVWYARRILPAPAIAAKTWPTPTPDALQAQVAAIVPPQPTQRPIDRRTPTPVPVPAFDHGLAVVPVDQTSTEQRMLLILARNLLPLAGLVGLVMIGIRITRRS